MERILTRLDLQGQGTHLLYICLDWRQQRNHEVPDKLVIYLAFVLLGGAASAISVAIRYKLEGKDPVKGAWLGFAGGIGSSVFILCIYILGFFPRLT